MRYFAAFTLLFCSVLASAQRQISTDLVPGLATEIYERIRDYHPFTGTYEGRAALDKARTQVQQSWESKETWGDSISYQEFIGLVAPLQQATGCGHLTLTPHFDSLTTQKLRENRFLLSTTLLADGTYVLKQGLRSTTDTLLPGTTVVAIDGQPVDELYTAMALFSGINDQGNDKAAVAKVAAAPYYYYQLGYGLKNSIQLRVIDDSGVAMLHEILSVQIPYVDPKKVKTDINRTLRFRFSKDGKAGILRIKKFSSYEFHNGNYYEFIQQVFDSLANTGTERLVIDLRGNGGGSSTRISTLYRYLAERPFRFAGDVRMTGPAHATSGERARTRRRREAGAVSRRDRRLQRKLVRPIKPLKEDRRFKGEVIVLIDHSTFSASGIFARYVQASGRGLLVGSTAGASAGVTYGARPKLDHGLLGPDDAFELRINTMALFPEYPESGNVKPDVAVSLTRAGLAAGKDEVLETALRLFNR